MRQFIWGHKPQAERQHTVVSGLWGEKGTGSNSALSLSSVCEAFQWPQPWLTSRCSVRRDLAPPKPFPTSRTTQFQDDLLQSKTHMHSRCHVPLSSLLQTSVLRIPALRKPSCPPGSDTLFCAPNTPCISPAQCAPPWPGTVHEPVLCACWCELLSSSLVIPQLPEQYPVQNRFSVCVC